MHVNAYRIAGLVPGSLSLILADRLPWNEVFWITGAFMLPGMAMAWLVSEPAVKGMPKTLRQAVERYRDEITPTKGSEKNERLRLEAFLRDFPALCDRRLLELQPDDLQGWVTTRLKTVKPDTVKRESHTLSNVWTVAAKRWRWVPLESPWANVTIPREGPPRDRRIGWREVRRVCRALGYVSRTPPLTLSQETALAWLLALRTAMRSGELLGLTLPFAGLDGLKFQQVITPGMEVELELSWHAPLLAFTYRSALGQHASGKVRFEGEA